MDPIILILILLLVFGVGGVSWYGGPARGGYGHMPGGILGLLLLVILAVYVLRTLH